MRTVFPDTSVGFKPNQTGPADAVWTVSEGARRSLVRCEKRDSEWYYMQGKVLMAMEEFDSAHQSFREAVRMDPENNVFRAGALAAAVAQQKAQKLPGKVKRVFKHLVKR